MEIDATFFLFAVPAVIFAGMSKGGFGSGAAFAASPFLALVIEPKMAVGMMLPLLMLMDITALRTYWRKWSWRDARALMIGAVPGIFVGGLLFNRLNPDALRFLIGTVAVGFVMFQAARKKGWLTVEQRPFEARRAGLWGAIAGFTSFISHAGGPPAAIHLLGQRLSKTEYQATTVITFWWINLVKFVPYILVGMFTRETALADLYLAPAAIAGVLIGVWAHHRINDRLFFSLTYIFLTLTGLKLILDAVF